MPAAVCLAAATHTKDEGLAFAAAVLLTALVVTLARSRQRVVPLLITGVVVLVAYAPWRVWISTHGPLASDFTPLSKSLDPGFLWDQRLLLDHGAQMLLSQLYQAGPFGWRSRSRSCCARCSPCAARGVAPAAYFLGVIALTLAAVLWAYWTYDDADPVGHIDRTSVRTITGPLFLCAAALAFLLPRVAPEAQPPRQ